MTDQTKPADDWFDASWREAAAQYHKDRNGRALVVETDPEHLKRLRRLMSDNVSLEYAQYEINRAAHERSGEAPEATYNAVQYQLREYGLSQLSKPNCQQRLADLSPAQTKNLMASLQQRRGQYPNVSDELLSALAKVYNEKVGGDD